MVDEDEIVNAAIAGASHQQIAKRFAIATHEVRLALDDFASQQLKPSSRATHLALEVSRLD